MKASKIFLNSVAGVVLIAFGALIPNFISTRQSGQSIESEQPENAAQVDPPQNPKRAAQLEKLLKEPFGWRSIEDLRKAIYENGDSDALYELIFVHREALDIQLECADELINRWEKWEACYDAYWILNQKYALSQAKDEALLDKARWYLLKGALHDDVRCFQELATLNKEDKQVGYYFYYLARNSR